MKHIKEYLENVIKVKPLGQLSTREDILNDMSGEMVYIDGKCTDIFISHADYANWLESKDEQKPFNYECASFQQKDFAPNEGHKFKVGNIISDGNVVYRVDEISKNAIGQDCYFLVDIEKEKKGTRYCKLHYSDGSVCYDGETTWLCEQVDRKFWIKKD